MDKHTNYFQIILSRVPHKNGNIKSYTFSKKTKKSYIDYYDLFKFIETKTGVPRRYFILHQGKTIIKFTSLINDITPYCSRYIPKSPFDLFDVSINLHADKIMFYKHKQMLQHCAHENTDKLLVTINAICNYVNILLREHTIVIDYYELLARYCDSEIIQNISKLYNPPLFDRMCVT